MQVKRIPIKAQDYDKVVHMDQSATHWSLEHSNHAAAAQSALQTYKDLVAAKNQCVSEIVKSSGLKDMGSVVQARLIRDDKGESFVEILLRAEEQAPPAEPSAEAAQAPAS